MAPAELEGCLLSHPDVHDACVVGVPDEYNGELPIAYVVLSEAAAKCVNRDASMSTILRSSIMKARAVNSLVLCDTNYFHPSQHLEVRKTSYKHLSGVRFIEAIPVSHCQKIAS